MRPPVNQSHLARTKSAAESPKILVAISVIIFLVGMTACGSSASVRDGSAGVVRAVAWQVNTQVGKRTARLAAAVPYCGYNRPKPRVQRVRKVEHPRSAVITMFVFFPRVGKGGCTDVELGVMKTVRLGRPISKISLYDGSVTPPRKRWPRFRSA
jgi:hypothetical protein